MGERKKREAKRHTRGERRRCSTSSTSSTSTSRRISRGDGGCDAVGCPHGWCCYSERYVRNTHARCLASKEARDLVRPQPCALGCNSMQLRCPDRILVLQEGLVCLLGEPAWSCDGFVLFADSPWSGAHATHQGQHRPDIHGDICAPPRVRGGTQPRHLSSGRRKRGKGGGVGVPL